MFSPNTKGPFGLMLTSIGVAKSVTARILFVMRLLQNPRQLLVKGD
jgi:hypothetical protein